MALISLRGCGIAFVLFALLAPIHAIAGPVYLTLVFDPATTAGAGVPTIARQFSSGTFSVTSTQSGAGKWHLYALDDISGSLGLAGFSVPVGGGTSGHLNRSTNGSFTNYGDADETVVESSGTAGFSDALVRSGVGANPANPIQGNQLIGSFQGIPGYGITAGNLNNTPNLSAPSDHRTWGGVTSGQWGNYATDPASINGKNWLFLGEGSYSGGGFPSIGSAVAINHYDSSNNGIMHLAPVPSSSIQVLGGCLECFPPIVQDVFVDNVNASNPGLVSRTLNDLNFSFPPATWSNFAFDSYVPAVGASGTGPATPATFNTSSHLFSWNTVGSPLGTYKWFVTASNSYGSDQGSITVRITAVPEPASLLLVSLATFAGCLFSSRRSAARRK